jgi:putative hydrolase of the HAD superfamily
MALFGRPRGIRAVLFDLGGTLVDERQPAMWSEVAQSLGISIEPEAIAHAFNETEELFDKDPESHTPEELWGRVLSEAWGGSVGPERAARFREGIEKRREAPLVFSDVLWCLEELARKKFHLGIVSNSRSEESVRDILDRAGIGRRFGSITSSGTEGVRKPNPEIFRRALAKLGLGPTEAFYVGNLKNTDALAAIRAGITAVWLNRGGTGFGEDPPEVTSLSEVPGLVLGAMRAR